MCRGAMKLLFFSPLLAIPAVALAQPAASATQAQIAALQQAVGTHRCQERSIGWR